MMRWGWVVAIVVAGMGVQPAFADGADHCVGDTPQFRAGFAAIASALGPTMGSAITCEYPDPNGTGDTEQRTSNGLVYWRKSTNTPTFTNGAEHWAWAPSATFAAGAIVYWPTASIDPPPNLLFRPSAPAPVVVAPPNVAPVPMDAAPPQFPYAALPGDAFSVVRANWAWLVADGSGTRLSIETAEALGLGSPRAIAALAVDVLRGAVKHLSAGTKVRLLDPAGDYFVHVQVVDGSNAGASGSVPNKAFHN